MKRYSKENQTVYVFDKFVYCSSVYQLWSWGAALVEEKYYSSSKPIKLKKNQIVLKKNKEYSLYRFFVLEYAPEEWLIKNNYKLIEEL